MTDTASEAAPVILFGAFDRHNFGDLLFPHIVSAMLGEVPVVCAGLAERDLRPYGGHKVESIRQLAARWGRHRLNIIHAGGEVLTCNARDAAIMLLRPDQAPQSIPRLGNHPSRQSEWVRNTLDTPSLAPYTVAPELFPVARMFYHGVGGVDLDSIDAAMRAEVLSRLARAEHVTVRDQRTLSILRSAGIAAQCLPDPAVMVAELFGDRIRQHAQQGEMAAVRHRFPQGWLAVQFSADFADDRTLAAIAAELDRAAAATGCGVVFFRAGAAPLHDDLALYRQAAASMADPSVCIAASLNLWDICALIAGSRAFCGSSLHGRIVAAACSVPHLNFHSPGQNGAQTKQGVWADSWEEGGLAVTPIPGMSNRLCEAIAVDAARREQLARKLVNLYRDGFEPIRAVVQ